MLTIETIDQIVKRNDINIQKAKADSILQRRN
jgi:hypothetical protein